MSEKRYVDFYLFVYLRYQNIELLTLLFLGVPCVKPPGMPIEQWQVEEQEFQNAVPQELRYLLPDIKERKEPLYKGDFGQALMNKLKSRFVSTEDSSVDQVKEKVRYFLLKLILISNFRSQ